MKFLCDSEKQAILFDKRRAGNYNDKVKGQIKYEEGNKKHDSYL